MQNDMQSRLDRAYEMANLDRDKHPKVKSIFETLFKVIDKTDENDAYFKSEFEEIGKSVKETHTQRGIWHGEIAT